MGIRRHGREAALQMLYQMDASGASPEDAIALFWASLSPDERDRDSGPQDEPVDLRDGAEFANRIVRGVAVDAARVDELIVAASHHWRLERMGRVDRCVLRLGTWELMSLSDVPRRVTLNEAVELAKRFGAEGSSAFVNGVLDRIATTLEKA